MSQSPSLRRMIRKQFARFVRPLPIRPAYLTKSPSYIQFDLLENRTLLSGVTNPVDPPTYQETFNDNDASDFDQNAPADWSINNGEYVVNLSGGKGVGTSTIDFHGFLPQNFEMAADITSVQSSGDWHDGFLIFDYQGENDFKYAGFFTGKNEFVIGHYEGGWGDRLAEVDWDAEGRTIDMGTSYTLHLKVTGNEVELSVDGEAIASATYEDNTSLNGGALGMAAVNSVTKFDNFIIAEEVLAGRSFVPLFENFEDGRADDFVTGNGPLWTVENLGHTFVYESDSSNGKGMTTSVVDVYGTLSEKYIISVDMTQLAASNSWQDGFVIFDYQSDTDFKFAGSFAGQNQWVIGEVVGNIMIRRTEIDWDNSGRTINPEQSYHLDLLVSGNEVDLSVDGEIILETSFPEPLLNTGRSGLMTKNALTRFDNFEVKPMPMDPGGDLDSLYDIGLLTSGFQTQGSVGVDGYGHYDTEDVFRFVINQDSSVRLKMIGHNDSVSFTLFHDKSGDGIYDSNERVESNIVSGQETMVENVPAGEYFIRISSVYTTHDRDYSFDLSHTPIPGLAPDPGETIAEATDLGVLNSPQALYQIMGGSDISDIYRLDLQNHSQLTVNLSGHDEALSLKLYEDINQNGVLETAERLENWSSDSSLVMTEALSSGTYFVEVAPRWEYSNSLYNIEFSQNPLDIPVTDPGDNIATAVNLGILNSPLSASHVLGGSDEMEVYRFEITNDASVTVDIDGITEQVNFYLYQNSNSNTLLENFEDLEYLTPSSPTSIVTDLPKGVYYIVLTPRWDYSNTAFTLNLSQNPLTVSPVDPGNDMASARNLGVLNADKLIRDVIGGRDTQDLYRFEILADATVAIDLSGINEQVYFSLYHNSNGNSLLESFEDLERLSISSETSLIDDLPAGEYYILVEPRWDYSNTAYTLNLSQTPLSVTPTDPGDTIATAYDLGTLTSNLSASQVIGAGDPSDLFRFEILSDLDVTLNLTGLREHSTMELFADSNGNEILENSEGIQFRNSTQEISMTESLTAGVYFIRVARHNDDDSSAFSLDILATASSSAAPISDNIFSDEDLLELV
ncbi:hypothetical protein Pla110_39710 [Polystyrenella longa]|uniref:Peptidase C-terminal archaeal/bacterial domain-containing protein n=1 Tax=Polystyrenella longa TaxID=2528007 RepID=A0A518CSM3_9PLAN|nr:PPC domain-containing protein [Polystyrenella longa]QDU82216.1 hypothetical protein Pla110_39710 [Polystyrenella longa]